MGKPKGESRGLSYLTKRRPRAIEHLLKFFGESAKHLEPKTRFLISVVTKVINFSPRGIEQYVRRAMEAGASADEVIDAVLCSYPCAGLTKVVDAIDVILDLGIPGFEHGEHGEDGPVEEGATREKEVPEVPPAPPAVTADPTGGRRGSRWVNVAGLEEIPPGNALRVLAGLLDIAIFNVEGELHAIDNRCPHRAGPLVKGQVFQAPGTGPDSPESSIVRCPLHGWKFHLRSGESIDHPGTRVVTYPVRVAKGEPGAHGERVEVLLPE